MKVHPIPAENAQQVDVVGERFYRPALERIVGTPPLNMAVIQPVPVFLKREPTNANDSQAVAVIIQGEIVGHLSADDAEHFAPELDRVEAAGAVALVQGTLWCKTTDEGLMSNVRIQIPRDWVFDGFIDDAEYVAAPGATKEPKRFRGPWFIILMVVVLELIFLPYPVNVILALLTFSASAFTLGIVKLRNQKSSE